MIIYQDRICRFFCLVPKILKYAAPQAVLFGTTSHSPRGRGWIKPSWMKTAGWHSRAADLMTARFAFLFHFCLASLWYPRMMNHLLAFVSHQAESWSSDAPRYEVPRTCGGDLWIDSLLVICGIQESKLCILSYCTIRSTWTIFRLMKKTKCCMHRDAHVSICRPHQTGPK